MIQIRREVLDVRESPMVQVATIAEGMPGSVKLCYGESDMVTPDFIRAAAADAMRDGHTFYTHTAGYSQLREAIAAKVYQLHGVTYRPSEVMSTVGATAAIFTAIRTFVGPGDNAVVISPSYAIFTNGVIMSGGVPREAPLAREAKRFRLDLERVERAIDARTRMVIVNSPSNPTGWVITVEEQKALYALAERHNLIILADEVYERLVFDRVVAPSFACVAENRDYVIVVNSFSKTYNMTGWRLGWALASEPTIRHMYKAAEFITSNAAAMVQQAGIVALRDGEAYVRDLREHYAQRRAQVKVTLERLPRVSLLEPDGAFYAFFQVQGVYDSTAFTTKLVRETGLALTPGAAFGEGGEGYIRMCFAASEPTVREALRRFGAFVTRSE